jgi:exodeoxyribonuclease VIII
MDENSHKIVLTQEQYDTVYTMSYHVKQHEIIDTLIGEALFERSIFWTDKETGLQFKVRPDIWSNKMVVDLKTSKDAAPGLFINSAYRYGYYLQCGMFFEACEAIGRPIDMFVNLVIEKEEPYVPAVFIMNEKAIEFGREQFNVYKRKIKECMDSDKWPGYTVQEISIPGYAKINDEEE